MIDDFIWGRLPSGSRENLPPNPLDPEFFAAGSGLWDRQIAALKNIGNIGFGGLGPTGINAERGSTRLA